VIADWAALPIGIVFATMATMVGIAGGVLWTPYLIFVARLDASQAILVSLLIQVAGMGSGAVAVMRQGKTDIRLATALAAAALPGVAAGAWLSTIIPAKSLVFLLGAILLATALVFVYAREELGVRPVDSVNVKQAARYLPFSTLFSILTGLLSVGAGDFMVPILRNRLRMKMDVAIGACLLVMAANAVFGSCLHLMKGEPIAWRIVVWAIPGVLIGGQIGPRLADRIPDQTLKEIFIYGLSLLGIHVMFNA
jgi:uncharacterized protein